MCVNAVSSICIVTEKMSEHSGRVLTLSKKKQQQNFEYPNSFSLQYLKQLKSGKKFKMPKNDQIIRVCSQWAFFYFVVEGSDS